MKSQAEQVTPIGSLYHREGHDALVRPHTRRDDMRQTCKLPSLPYYTGNL